MRHPARSPLLRPALAVLSFGACAPAAAPVAAPEASVAAAEARAEPAWPGLYRIVGSNFPEGSRAAQLEVSRADTTYRLAVFGPPGELLAFRIVADSAHVLWDLGDGSDELAVALRLVGDSLTGRWQIGPAEGPIAGRRVR